MITKQLISEKTIVDTKGKIRVLPSPTSNKDWKKKFYKIYRAGEYELATQTYFKIHPYRSDLMNVHEAYKLEKRTDKEVAVCAAIFSMMFLGLLFLIFS